MKKSALTALVALEAQRAALLAEAASEIRAMSDEALVAGFQGSGFVVVEGDAEPKARPARPGLVLTKPGRASSKPALDKGPRRSGRPARPDSDSSKLLAFVLKSKKPLTAREAAEGAGVKLRGATSTYLARHVNRGRLVRLEGGTFAKPGTPEPP